MQRSSLRPIINNNKIISNSIESKRPHEMNAALHSVTSAKHLVVSTPLVIIIYSCFWSQCVRVTHAMHKHLVFVLLHNRGEAITKIISICSCRRRRHRMDKQFGFKINRTAHVYCSVSVLSVLQHHRVEFPLFRNVPSFGYCLFTHWQIKN